MLVLALAAACGREETATSVTPRPGIHDHTPHHGGVVTMVGMQHLEAVATDGRFRVYLSDVWRRPLPLDGVSGSVTLDSAGRGSVLSLAPHGDALEAALPPDAPPELRAHVQIARADQVLEANYVLPLGGGALGAAGVPPEGCVAPARASDPGVRRPRCTIAFGKPVTFVAATPGGDTALVAIAGAGISAWTMPGTRFARGFEPAPAIAAPADAAPHADVVNALALSPTGEETAVAIENRLLVHTTASGRLARELPSFRGAIRSVAWARDRLLVSLFYDRAAHLLAASDGRELRRLEVEREGAGVALSPDAKLAAVGSELGAIAVSGIASDAPPRLLVDSARAAVALAFTGDRLVSASADGVVRMWDPRTGALAARGDAAVGLTRLAVAPGGRVVASAGLDHTIRLHDVATGALREALPWHRAAVWGLAWCGATLVSGDGDGEVAVWDLGDRLD
ncbi:MAG TPA: hypothetical protein VKU61_09700 [Candidatus Binatia bacterium]|nr:hypothetical protein [Candidatus Binatia bacterium]